MTPGAVAAILYSRCRSCDPTFLLESEYSPDEECVTCFIVTASWQHHDGGRTYSAQLAIDVPDVVILLRRSLASLDQRASRGS